MITGGAGFIGSAFVRHWRDRYPADAILVVDALTYAGVRSNLDGVADIRFVEADVRDDPRMATLLADAGVDTIVHFAAETHVDRSIADPGIFVDVNVVGTQRLLQAAKAVWLDRGTGRPHRFHHISTDEVYGSLDDDAPAFTEATPYRPNSPYAASKAASDHLVRAFAHSYGLQATISNCSNNFGPRQFPEKLIPLVITRALRGQPLPIYGDGHQRRDWLHVDDHCDGIERVLLRGRAGETYNLGGGVDRANLEVIDSLCAIIDGGFARDPALVARFPAAPPAGRVTTSTLKRFVADRPGHDQRYAIDCGKAVAELGYRPEGRFEQRLFETVQWYLDTPQWWEPLIARR
jgi:dTDP-glucose 4,6-dehydratase